MNNYVTPTHALSISGEESISRDKCTSLQVMTHQLHRLSFQRIGVVVVGAVVVVVVVVVVLGVAEVVVAHLVHHLG